jgi:hypothetical protein
MFIVECGRTVLICAIQPLQEMKAAKKQGELRTGQINEHDKSFKLEIDHLNRQCKAAFET